jgi:hypothetical protein
LETVFRDYAPKGVKFYYIYKTLAHPEYIGYVNPFTLEERLMHVAEAKRTLGMEIPWLVDNMENTLKEVLSKRFSNAELIVDAQGKVIENVPGVVLRKSVRYWRDWWALSKIPLESKIWTSRQLHHPRRPAVVWSRVLIDLLLPRCGP